MIFLLLTRSSLCYKENPEEYEEESVRHIDYEKDEMPIKLGEYEGSTSKVKRINDKSSEYREILDPINENEQTPAEDRNWQVKPKVKRMSSRGGKKVHIYLKSDDKSKRKPTTAATTTTSSSPSAEKIETTTRYTPESTTKKADNDVKYLRFTEKDSKAEGSSVKKTATPSSNSDSEGEGSDHHESHVIKEKIKIKHHHHHHHHNHVKTVVKKEPYPVEKVVHVPYEKIVEKKVKVEVPVEKIVEKVKANFIMKFQIYSFKLFVRLCMSQNLIHSKSRFQLKKLSKKLLKFHMTGRKIFYISCVCGCVSD